MRSMPPLRMLVAGPALVALTACGIFGPDDVESVDIQMQRTDDFIVQQTAQVVAYFSASTSGSQSAAVSPDTVASLTIRVTDIQFLPAVQQGNEENDGAWMSATLPNPVVLDLMTLPTEGESPIVVVSGSAPEGDYANVRLFVDEASIEFKGAISLGGAITFNGGEPYTVTIPSGEDTGLKTDASFSVSKDEDGNLNDVTLLFSTGSTFQNVTGTGTGEVILAPVIRGAPAQGS